MPEWNYLDKNSGQFFEAVDKNSQAKFHKDYVFCPCQIITHEIDYLHETVSGEAMTRPELIAKIGRG